MGRYVSKEGEGEKFVTDAELGDALRSGWSLSSGGKVSVRDTAGERIEATPEQATSFDSDVSGAGDVERARQQFHEGDISSLETFGAGLASGATLGGMDALERAYDPAAADEDALAARVKPGARMAGEVVGTILPSVLPGGDLLPTGMAMKGAEGLGKLAGEGLAGSALRYGTEGFLLGGGQGLAEAARNDELGTEHAMSTISTSALLGGGLGLGASVAGHALEKGFARARKLTDAAKAGKVTEGSELVDEVANYNKARSDTFLVAKGGHKKVWAAGKGRLIDRLDAPKDLARRPEGILKTLGKDEKVLQEIVDEGTDATLARLGQNDAKVAEAVQAKLDKFTLKSEAKIAKLEVKLQKATKEGKEVVANAFRKDLAKEQGKMITLDKKLASEYRDVIGKSGSGSIELSADDARGFLQDLQTGKLEGARREALAQVPTLLEQNRALQTSIESAAEAGKSEAANLANKARGAAATYAVGAVTGFLPGGPIGAFAAPLIVNKLGDLVFGRLGKAGAAAGERWSQATRALFDAGSKAAKVVPPLSTRVLAGARFGGDGEPAEGRTPPKSKQPSMSRDQKLVAHYQAREKELRQQVEVGDDGALRMTPGARAKVAERLSGVRAVSPKLADRIESHAARRVTFLASKLPRRPDIPMPRWRPSETAIRTFARYVAAVDDPAAIIERTAAGAVSPEDAETLREVYPEMCADLQKQLLANLPELREKLSFKRRVALSILTGVPVDPSLHPRILAVLQAQYATEPGTDGGLHAPTPQPAFGSVRKSIEEPTAAQRRASPERL